MHDYYAIQPQHFAEHSPVAFRFVDRPEDLWRLAARQLVDLIKANLAHNQMTKVILPIGPLEYGPFAQLCNKEGVSCESLVIFSMDEYVQADGAAIAESHPLSFRAFYRQTFLDCLDDDKRLPEEQLIMPDPQDLGLVARKLEQYGPIDLTFGGFGINGHFAFNSPPAQPMSVEEFRNTSVRIVRPREGDAVQMAIGATGGNLELIPPLAVTLGMRELLSAKKIHLTFVRSWHAGVLRRALFGPITPEFPGSLVQLHPHVEATVTSVAAATPQLHILQQPGK